MFDLMNKANALMGIASELEEIISQASGLDENDNGILDGEELLQHLKDLPALIMLEGSQVVAEAEDAREKIGNKMRAMMVLAGADISAVQSKSAARLAKLKKKIEALK